jgi:hypothetical protein
MDDLIRQALRYNPDTGKLFWKGDFGARAKEGAEAGSIDSKGYVVIRLKGKNMKAHRVAFFLKTGKWPAGEIDHDNQIKNDNRWANLKDCTQLQNMQNRPLQVNNSTGYKGVVRRGDRFQGLVQKNKKRVSVGYFDTAEEANEACIKARACN